ncbi:hypothetical protein DFH08DRAFT_804457 [Mycena albidolilacea]|uniref:Uncharacterized protein n=1 Tax=Mycena albidolilacea TaxID=1033008 RepID=A0AAD7EVS4_9AGAR|nr:hypothetical protein DFH08DRAFT_804457 [Mycena albidolilacea]
MAMGTIRYLIKPPQPNRIAPARRVPTFKSSKPAICPVQVEPAAAKKLADGLRPGVNAPGTRTKIPIEPDMGQCKGAKLVRAPGMDDNPICRSTGQTIELKSMESSFKFRPSEHWEGLNPLPTPESVTSALISFDHARYSYLLLEGNRLSVFLRETDTSPKASLCGQNQSVDTCPFPDLEVSLSAARSSASTISGAFSATKFTSIAEYHYSVAESGTPMSN